MQKPPPPARLHVLMARQAPFAVILRRGPARYVCSIGWDRTTDTFAVGQWLRGRIYEERADLSPDGRHMVYFAGNFNWHSETKGTWTAISKAPYLKSIMIWAKGDTWGGGGIFLDNETVLLNGSHGDKLESSGAFRVIFTDRVWKQPKVETKFSSDGHQLEADLLSDFLSPEELAIFAASSRQRFSSYRAFEKYRAGWRLDNSGNQTDLHRSAGRHVTRDWWLRRPGNGLEYQLINRHKDLVVDLPNGTTWADADHYGDVNSVPNSGRVAWTNAGRLYVADVTRAGLAEPRMLFDFNLITYQRIEAPY